MSGLERVVGKKKPLVGPGKVKEKEKAREEQGPLGKRRIGERRRRIQLEIQKDELKTGRGAVT